MNSNIKPKSTAKEAPTEPFKRAVGVCLRAIAGKNELERPLVAEFYQRCFGQELPESSVNVALS